MARRDQRACEWLVFLKGRGRGFECFGIDWTYHSCHDDCAHGCPLQDVQDRNQYVSEGFEGI